MGDGVSLEEPLVLVEARQAIAQLVAEYSHGADKRQLGRFLAVWHDGAVWDVGVARFQGLAEIEAAIRRQWAHQPQMVHWTTNLSIELACGSARALAEVDVAAVTQTSAGDWVQSAGTYRDVYEQRQGRWGLVLRSAHAHFTHRVPGLSESIEGDR